MENTHPLTSVNSVARHGCYAAIPGTGPHGTVCSGCNRLEPQGSRFLCGHFRTLTGRTGKAISPGSASCRYFTERPAFNATKGA